MLFSLLYCLKMYLGINYGIFTITLGIDLIKIGISSIVMYNFGVGPSFAYVSASARHAK